MLTFDMTYYFDPDGNVWRIDDEWSVPAGDAETWFPKEAKSLDSLWNELHAVGAELARLCKVPVFQVVLRAAVPAMRDDA